MGFMDFLKGALNVGGALAGPFTGGASSALTKALTAGSHVGGALGAIGDARGQGRAQQADANLNSDVVRQRADADRQRALLEASQQKTNAQVAAGDLDLKQKQFGLDRQGQTLSNIIRGGVANRIQDTHMNRPNGIPEMSFSGGLRPSLIGQAGRDAGAEMERRGLLDMMNPEAMAALPTSSPEVSGPFRMTPQPEAGVLDKILGAAGTVGGISTGVLSAQDAIKKLMAEKNRRAMSEASPGLTPIGNMASLPGGSVPLPQPPQRIS